MTQPRYLKTFTCNISSGSLGMDSSHINYLQKKIFSLNVHEKHCNLLLDEIYKA